LLISSTFQRTNGIVPFCECKGTAFILITKQKHKKNHFFFVFFQKSGFFSPFSDFSGVFRRIFPQPYHIHHPTLIPAFIVQNSRNVCYSEGIFVPSHHVWPAQRSGQPDNGYIILM
jgi:hypothetical protein